MSSALVAALHVLLLAILLVDVFPWFGSRPSTTPPLAAVSSLCAHARPMTALAAERLPRLPRQKPLPS